VLLRSSGSIKLAHGVISNADGRRPGGDYELAGIGAA